MRVAGKSVVHVVILPLLWAYACTNAADSSVFSTGGGRQVKPVSTQDALMKANKLDAGFGAPTKVANANYIITVTSNSGDRICTGDATINVMSNFTMRFPEAVVECLNLKIDIASMIGAGFTGSKSGLANFSSDGAMLSAAALGNAKFTPPRPFLLGPVIQDVNVYNGFSRSVATVVDVVDAKTKEHKTANGEFDVEVIPDQTTGEVLTSYANQLSPKNSFDKVLHWSVSASGFDGVAAKDGLIFKRMEWFWNVQPVMIPKLVIYGELTDFIGNSNGGSSVSPLLGDIKIEVTVKDYDFDG